MSGQQPLSVRNLGADLVCCVRVAVQVCTPRDAEALALAGVALELGIDAETGAGVEAVAYAQDREGDAVGLDLLPVDRAVPLAHVDALGDGAIDYGPVAADPSVIRPRPRGSSGCLHESSARIEAALDTVDRV